MNFSKQDHLTKDEQNFFQSIQHKFVRNISYCPREIIVKNVECNYSPLGIGKKYYCPTQEQLDKFTNILKNNRESHIYLDEVSLNCIGYSFPCTIETYSEDFFLKN